MPRPVKDTLTPAINQVQSKIEAKGISAVIQCQALISKTAMPLTPKSRSNEAKRKAGIKVGKTPDAPGGLRRSLSTPYPEVEGSGASRVIIGKVQYNVNYAIYVHEMGIDPETGEQVKTINWSTPGTGNRFLLRAMEECGPKCVEIFKRKLGL